MSTEKKVCSFCSLDKSLNDFYCNSNAKDGRQAYCKECFKTYSAGRRDGNRKRILKSCARTQAIARLKRKHMVYLQDLYDACREPAVHRMMRHIHIAEILDCKVPPAAMVPFGYDFAD